MDSSLVLFLEENGYVCYNNGFFVKTEYHKLAKKIEIMGYGSYANQTIDSFSIDVYSEIKDWLGDERLILWIKICNLENLETKIKIIIKNIQDIITSSYMNDGCAEFNDINNKDDQGMIISSYDGIVVDLSSDEIIIRKDNNYAINEK